MLVMSTFDCGWISLVYGCVYSRIFLIHVGLRESRTPSRNSVRFCIFTYKILSLSNCGADRTLFILIRLRPYTLFSNDILLTETVARPN